MSRDPFEVAEKAASARALLMDPIVREIVDSLRHEYIQELIQAPVGDLTASTAHAKVKVLEDFMGRLQSIINDEAMILKYGKGKR